MSAIDLTDIKPIEDIVSAPDVRQALQRQLQASKKMASFMGTFCGCMERREAQHEWRPDFSGASHAVSWYKVEIGAIGFESCRFAVHCPGQSTTKYTIVIRHNFECDPKRLALPPITNDYAYITLN